MKKVFWLLALFTLSAAPSYGAPMYLKKIYSLYNSTGSYVLTCKFYSRKVEITETRGASSSLRVVPTAYSGATLARLIGRARTNTLRSEPFAICDGGSADVKAYKGSSAYTLLKFEDCGARKYYRNGPSSLILRGIVEHYCESYMP